MYAAYRVLQTLRHRAAQLREDRHAIAHDPGVPGDVRAEAIAVFDAILAEVERSIRTIMNADRERRLAALRALGSR